MSDVDTVSPKEALADAVLAHFEGGGRLDESLRTTASAVGASHSLLLYHFGSRDGMLTAVQLAAERRQRDHLLTLRLEAGDPMAVMEAMWAHVTDERMLPLYRLGFSLGATGLDLSVSNADRARWLAALAPLVEAFGIDAAEDEALLWVGMARGLIWERLTGAEPAAVDRAARRMFAHLAQSASLAL